MTLKDIINTINQVTGSNIKVPESSGTQGKRRGKNKGLRTFTTVITLVILVFLAFTTVFMVDETEQAVVLRFGQYNRIVGPGLNFKLPIGIEKNNNVPTRIIQNQTFGFRTAVADIVSQRSTGDFSNESTMLTGDLNIVNVEWIIQYRISNPTNWLFKVSNKQKTLRDISISVVNQLVGDYYITDVLGDARTEIEESALVLMNDFFREYELGINVTAVRLQNIVPPQGVQNAFEDVNKAVQDMNRLINEGREAYNKEIPKSRGQAEKIIQEAQGYATERINLALGDVARFNSVLQQYNLSPQVTRDRIYYETLETIFGEDSRSNTKFIDGDFENIVPFLPLNSQSVPTVQQTQ